MSTSNPVLSAAAPSLITVLQQLETMVTTITTGDPALIAARVEPALQIFLGQVMLQLPGLESAELSAVQTTINTKIGSLIASLQKLTPAT
jgi:hypothetical protein